MIPMRQADLPPKGERKGSMEQVIRILEYVGVFAFAVSGTIVAIQEDFDLFGICCVAMVTAMGGGVLRDIVADVGVPAFFQDWTTIPIILVAVAIATRMGNRWEFNRLFVFVDAVGLATFVVSAGLKAIGQGYNLMLFLFASGITGVGGGILRDIIVNRKPAVFQSDIYTVAGLAGALVLWFTCPWVGTQWSALVSLVLIVTVRMFCYLHNINLPVFRYGNPQRELENQNKTSE